MLSYGNKPKLPDESGHPYLAPHDLKSTRIRVNVVGECLTGALRRFLASACSRNDRRSHCPLRQEAERREHITLSITALLGWR